MSVVPTFNPYDILAPPDYVVPGNENIPEEAIREYDHIAIIYPNLFEMLLVWDRRYIDSEYHRNLFIERYQSDLEACNDAGVSMRRMMYWNRILSDEERCQAGCQVVCGCP